MSRERTENKIRTRFILMQTSVYVHSENQHLGPIAKTVRHWYFITNVQNVRRLQKRKHGETLAPLLDGVADNALVHALPLLSDARPQLIQNPDILSVYAFLEHAPYTIVYWS